MLTREGHHVVVSAAPAEGACDRSIVLPKDLARVLVIMTDHHLGNTVLSIPVIEAMARYFTHGLDLLVDERYVALFQLLSTAKKIRVLSHPSQSVKRRGIVKNLRPLLLLGRLGSRRYQAVIDLAGGIRSTTIVLASLSPIRIGFHGSRRDWSYTRQIDTTPDMHYFDRYAQVLQCIGDTRPLEHHRLQTSASDRHRVAALVQAALPQKQGPIAVIHPSCGKAWRHWPIERFAEVADRLARDFAMRVCIIGTRSDQPLADELTSRMSERDRACFLNLSLVELVSLFEIASILISNESGPTHLAATTDLPIVTIFGPTQESLWKPIRPSRLAVMRGSACDPGCARGHCVADRKCLNQLSVDHILKAIGELIGPPLAHRTC